MAVRTLGMQIEVLAKVRPLLMVLLVGASISVVGKASQETLPWVLDLQYYV
jgi:hypothetical protein